MRYFKYFFFKEKKIYIIFLINLIFLFTMMNKNLIVNMDWSFPHTVDQLSFKFNEIFNYYSYKENPLGEKIAHINDLSFRILSKIFASFQLNGSIFQKVYIIIIITATFFSAFSFLKNCSPKNTGQLSIYLSIIFYIFSIVYFNFFQAGWIYVLLYLSLQFLFCNCLLKIYLEKKIINQLIYIFWIISICFAQSQSVVWFGILNFYIFLYYMIVEKKIFKKTILYFLIINLVIVISIFSTNFFWILDSSFVQEESVKKISAFDWNRFNKNINYIDLFLFKNFLFNRFYESILPSFIGNFYIINLIPIFLVIFHILKKRNLTFILFFGLTCYLTLFFAYIFQDLIRLLPFSNVIRDLNRFVVISHLGATLIFFSCCQIYSKNLKILVILFLILIINISPFFYFKLDYNQATKNMISYTREMPFSKKDNKYINNKNDYKKIIIPTGAHLKLFNSDKFFKPHQEIYDPYAYYSENISNFFISEKSSELLKNFYKEYVQFYKNDFDDFLSINKVIGISNILVRSYSLSSANKYFNTLKTSEIEKNCNFLSYDNSRFNFDCVIENPYPEVFLSDEIYCNKFDIKKHYVNRYVTNLNCEDLPSEIGDYYMATIQKIEKKKHIIYLDIENIKGGFLLNLNKKYNKNIFIQDIPNLNVKQYKSNKYFNSWLVKTNLKELKLEIVDKNIKKYNNILNLQLSLILILLIISLLYCFKNLKKQI